MDLKEIQNLIKFVARSGASEVSLETEDFKITIKTHTGVTYPVESVPLVAHTAPAHHVVEIPSVQQAPPAAAEPAKSNTPASDESKYLTIKSPMIGTFYRRPAPDKPPFVEVGSEIKKGQVVCIIEAMKLFNEIESEIEGRIVKVLVDDQKPVEYDQPLFLVEPL